MEKITLKELSRQLGYSQTLISMVLSGKGDVYGISKKTQEIVLDAIRKTNYIYKGSDTIKKVAKKVWDDIFSNNTLAYNDFESYYKDNFKNINNNEN